MVKIEIGDEKHSLRFKTSEGQFLLPDLPSRGPVSGTGVISGITPQSQANLEIYITAHDPDYLADVPAYHPVIPRAWEVDLRTGKISRKDY